MLLNHSIVNPCGKAVGGRTPFSYFSATNYEFRYDDGLSFDQNRNQREAAMEFIMSKTEGQIDIKDKLGRTPLSYAAEAGNGTLVRMPMSRYGAQLDSRDATGKTPVWWASFGRQ